MSLSLFLCSLESIKPFSNFDPIVRVSLLIVVSVCPGHSLHFPPIQLFRYRFIYRSTWCLIHIYR